MELARRWGLWGEVTREATMLGEVGEGEGGVRLLQACLPLPLPLPLPETLPLPLLLLPSLCAGLELPL